MRNMGAIRPDGVAVPSPTCSATIEPAVIAWRHGLAVALAVTDADVDCDAVLDGTSDAERAAEPEREPDAHAEMVFWIVTVGDADVLAEAREEDVPHALPERDAVIEREEAGLDVLGFLQLARGRGVEAGPAEKFALIACEEIGLRVRAEELEAAVVA